MNTRARIFITGKVQGVFFRQTLKVTSKKNNILGWTKNLKDGRVEAVLEGDHANVKNVIEWCRTGPANSIVYDVKIEDEKFTGEYSKFSVLY